MPKPTRGLRRAFVALALLTLGLIGTEIMSADYEKIAERTLFNGEKLVEYRLPNGLQVLHIPRHQAKVVTYQIWFRVGSVDEKLDPKLKKTGLAHLFEHMMFRGTPKYPDGVFDKIVSRIGGTQQNATTYFYRTNYFESIPSNQIETLMELESDRMRNLLLTSDLFEKEKGAVVGEYRQHMDSPVSVAFDELLRNVFTVAPYRWTILGTEEEIKGFKLEEAQYFYKTYYAPNNATIIVVGDVKEKPLLPLIVKFYGDMAPQEVPKHPIPEEPPQKKERKFETTHRQATSETLLIGYRIPSIQSDDIVPLALLSTHLSTGMEARLRKLLVDKGLAVRASSSPSSRPDLLEFVVQMAEGKKAEVALKIIDAEIEGLKKKPISATAFERALNQELLDLYGSIGSNSRLAKFLGEYLTVSGDYMRGFQLLEGFKKLKPADLQAAAKKHLDKKGRTIVIVRPQKGAGKKA